MVVTSRIEGGAGLPRLGEFLRRHVLPALGLSVVPAFGDLRVTRRALQAIPGARAAISPDRARRLERLRGAPGRLRLVRQMEHDLGRSTPAGIDVADRPAPRACVRSAELDSRCW